MGRRSRAFCACGVGAPPPKEFVGLMPQRDGRALASVVLRVALHARQLASAGAIARAGEVTSLQAVASAAASLDWQSQVVAPALRAGLRARAFLAQPPPTAGGVPHEVYVQLYAPAARLLVEAERTHMALPLDAAALADADEAENLRLVDEEGLSFDVRGADSEHMDLHIPAEAPDGGCCGPCVCLSGNALDAYARIHAPYAGARDRLFALDPSTGGLLSEAHALRLLIGVLEAGEIVEGGAGLDLDGLQAQGRVLRRWFPAHSAAGRDRLRAQWGFWLLPWQVPVAALREYMGEHVAFFFHFQGFFCRWMLLPALAGLAIFINQVVVGDPNTVYLPIYGLLVALWATLFTEMWRREQARTAQKWGTVGYKRDEPLRAEFIAAAERVRSLVDGKPTYAAHAGAASARRVASSIVTALSLAAVVVGIGSIFVLRVVLEQQAVLAGYSDYVTSIINAVVITVFNYAYTLLADALTRCENHATESVHRNNLVVKIAIFQIVNTFFGLTYTAFIKSSLVLVGQQQACQVGPAGAPDCLFDMQQQLAILIATRIAFTIAFDLLLPRMRACTLSASRCARNLCSRARRASDARWRAAVDASPLEAENEAYVYNPFDNYLSLMLLFGFSTLYVVALPLAPALVAVAIALNLYVDRNLILFVAARPTPEGAADIGAWLPVFETLSFICTVTNLGVVAFSNPGKPIFGYNFSYSQRLIFFIVAEHLVIAAKWAIAYCVPSVSPRTALQLQRQEYLVAKHILGVKDVVVQRRRSTAADYALARAKSGLRDAAVGAVGVATSYAALEKLAAAQAAALAGANAGTATPAPGLGRALSRKRSLARLLSRPPSVAEQEAAAAVTPALSRRPSLARTLSRQPSVTKHEAANYASSTAGGV